MSVCSIRLQFVVHQLGQGDGNLKVVPASGGLAAEFIEELLVEAGNHRPGLAVHIPAWNLSVDPLGEEVVRSHDAKRRAAHCQDACVAARRIPDERQRRRLSNLKKAEDMATIRAKQG